ncbi:hypothetical protein EAb13_CDS0105 [Acinetobacter phage EAb13]|nr:hypothetical protein EAb13_CDS0105 [Acinetobacter phage EAb13]
MAISLTNKNPHKEKFRLVDNQKIAFLGLLAEPPEDIRYSNNNVVRLLEVSVKTIAIQGKQIKSTGLAGACYLVGSFSARRDSLTYRAFEVTHYDQQWTRQVRKKHPVTGLDTTEMYYQVIDNINISMMFDLSPVRYDDNPTQYATIRTTAEVQAGDIVGDFLIRDVKLEYGLYCARAEYKTVKPNG